MHMTRASLLPMSLRGYQRSWLSGDIVAGATLAPVAHSLSAPIVARMAVRRSGAVQRGRGQCLLCHGGEPSLPFGRRRNNPWMAGTRALPRAPILGRL